MPLGTTVNNEVKAWTGVGIVVVLASLILLKIKEQDVAGDNCASGYNYSYNVNLCEHATNTSVANASVQGTGSTIDAFVTALSEPKNWVAIVIIAIIGFALLSYYRGKKNR